MRNRLLSLFSALGLLLAVGLPAPLTAQEQLVAAKASFEPATARPGETVTLRVMVTVEPGYHIYGTSDTTHPSRLVLENTGGLELKGDGEGPFGVPHGANFWVEGTSRFSQQFVVPAGTAEGVVRLAGALDHMVCDEKSCLPPAMEPFAAELTVSGTAVADGAAVDPMDQEPGGFGFGLGEGEHVTIKKVEFVPADPRPGEMVEIRVTAEVADGWHAYGALETVNIPVSVTIDSAGELELWGGALVPDGEFHEGVTEGYWLPPEFVVRQRFVVPEDMTPGEVSVSGLLNYAVCDDVSCLPPAEAPFSGTVTVVGGDTRDAQLPSDRDEQRAGGREDAADGGGDAGTPGDDTMSLWALILASIGGGLFALAMPCTYPMIPITFSFFTKQAERRGGSVLPLALVYGAGIVVMFVLVGLLLGTVIIEFAGGWGINLVFFIAFVVFAFALFGWIDLQPPRFLLNLSGKASTAGGLIGVFLMGATLVITSFTCTAPIAGTLLAQAAKGGGYQQTIIGMGIFGLTVALPFVVLALMPGRVKAMPKSGEWMYTLKVTLGFVELAAALKFLSMVDVARGWGIYPRELFLLSVALIFVLTGMFLFGMIRGPGAPLMGVSRARHGAGVVFFALATWFAYGAAGFKLDFITTNFAPPYSAQSVLSRGSSTQVRHTVIKDDYATAAATARAEDKLLLVNFTGFN